MALTENELTCQRFLFGLGFESKSSTDSRSHFTMMMRPMTAVIKTLFIVQNGLGLGGKKLHIFRSICTLNMSNALCSANEINQFVGWKTGTMVNYYADARSFALNSVTAYLLAGRKSKDDSPAAAWPFFDEIDTIQIWYLRIATVARVNFDCFPVDDSIKRRIDSYQAKVDKGELTTLTEQNSCNENESDSWN